MFILIRSFGVFTEISLLKVFLPNQHVKQRLESNLNIRIRQDSPWFRNPESKQGNPGSRIWNPESRIWNPESKDLLDYLTWVEVLFPKGRFGYMEDRKIKLSPVKHFNARLLHYSERFATNSEYLFFAQFVIEKKRWLTALI